MFGFLAPRRSLPAWRRSYARICQVQRQKFGLSSLPFLSYEATFLYQLAIDLQLVPALAETSPHCCRLRRLPRDEASADRAASCAAVLGVTLLGIKLDDDVADTGRWFHRLLQWKYRRQVRLARRSLRELRSNLPETIAAVVNRHRELEKRAEPPPIEEYSTPTADGFAAVFSATFDRLANPPDSARRNRFERIGACLGRAIIAWDCAVDYEHDSIRGHYNPLNSDADVPASLEYCQLQLARMAWELPPETTCSAVLADVTARVRARSRVRNAPGCHRRMERWGLTRERGFTYARCDCDCPCDGCGDCGACGDGGASGGCCDVIGCCQSAEGFGETAAGQTAWNCYLCRSFGADACCEGCCECCGRSSEQQEAERANEDSTDSPQETGPWSRYQGRTAVTNGLLNPAGYVMIDDERVPARTQSGVFLDDGVDVIVTACDAFGVSVRVSPDDAAGESSEDTNMDHH